MPLLPSSTTDSIRRNDQIRQSQSPSSPPPGVVRHATQGGFVPVKVKRSSEQAKLCLQLDQPNHYKAGDIVSGFVDLISERNGGHSVDVGSISITFSGRCTTTQPIPESSTCRRTLKLFSYRRTLFTGPAKMYAPNRSVREGARSSFPFQFTFPLNCNDSEMQHLEPAPFFNPNAHQTLPASFTDESHIDKASVVYELRCELLAPDYKGYYMQGSCFGHLNLNVYSPRTVREPPVEFVPYARSFTHQSLDLLSPAERKFHERPLTISQKLGIKSTITDHLPKASFTATVLIPSAAIIGQPLPLKLHIDHDTKTSTVTTPPIVHLSKIQVFLRIETSICGLKHQSMKGHHDQTGWTTGVQIPGKAFVNHVPRVEHLDLRKVVDLTLDPMLHPSFKSFNVARTYSLRVAGTIRCGGRSFAVKSGMMRCTFLAKDYALRLPGYDEPLFATGQEEHRLADEVPPPYAHCAQRMAPPYQQRPSSPMNHNDNEEEQAAAFAAPSSVIPAVTSTSLPISSNGGNGDTCSSNR